MRVIINRASVLPTRSLEGFFERLFDGKCFDCFYGLSNARCISSATSRELDMFEKSFREKVAIVLKNCQSLTDPSSLFGH